MLRVGLKRPAGGASGEAEEIRLVLNDGETALSGRECFFWSVNDWKTREVDVFEKLKMHRASLESVRLAFFRLLKKIKIHTRLQIVQGLHAAILITHTQLYKIK